VAENTGEPLWQDIVAAICLGAIFATIFLLGGIL
jgi:hypothetical protein